MSTETSTCSRGRLRIAILLFLGALGFASNALAAPVSGFVYDAKTGSGISGVELQLFYDDTDLSEPGMLVPADRLSRGQQNQKSGPDGSYQFEMPEGRLYRIEVTQRANRLSFPSSVVPPLVGFPRSGPVAPFSTPRGSGTRPFYIHFNTNLNNARFSNNHIAVDRSADVVSLQFASSQSVASKGDILSFTSVLTNGSQRNWVGDAGSEIYLRVAMAPGLDVDLGSARVSVGGPSSNSSALFAPARRDNPNSDRLIRFGPFDLNAGQTLRLRFLASVGVATRPGRIDSRIVATDVGGSRLSEKVSAKVEIVADRDLSTSTLTGRVFCDKDGNGWQSKRERGLFGAKVYSDTGAIATTDSAGRFHFTRIGVGSHVFKLDQGSLAGGIIVGSNRRLLHLTEGLSAQLSFGVRCKRKWIGAGRAKVVYPLLEIEIEELDGESSNEATTEHAAGAQSVAIRGRIQPLVLEVDGQRLDIPSVSLEREFDSSLLLPGTNPVGRQSLVAVPAQGYGSEFPRWKVSWTKDLVGALQSWQFSIHEVKENGFVEVFHRARKGNAPAVIEWTGLDLQSKPVQNGVYVASLSVVGESGTKVSTRRYTFGIGIQADKIALPTSPSEFRVDGRIVSVTKDGSVMTLVSVNAERILRVDLKSASGRQTAFDVDLDRRPSPTSPTAKWAVRGDLGSQSLVVDQAKFPSQLWGISAILDTPQTEGAQKLEIPEVAIESTSSGDTLRSPLLFQLQGASSLVAEKWRFVVIDESGQIVFKRSDKGLVPNLIQWDGMAPSFVLKPDTRYQYWLEVAVSSSVNASSASRWFHVAPIRSATLVKREGRFFGASGAAKANLRNILSGFVAKNSIGESAKYNIVLRVTGTQSHMGKSRNSFVTYLRKLGLRAPAYSLTLIPSETGPDKLTIAKSESPVVVSPSVTINNRLVAMQGSEFHEMIALNTDEALIVEVVTPNGANLRFSKSWAIEEMSEEEEEEDAIVSLSEIYADSTPAKSLRVKLPQRGVKLGDRQLAVHGTVAPGVLVRINGETTLVDPRGRFYAMVDLPLGKSELEVRAEDALGGSSTIHWPVLVAQSHTTAVGILQGIAATSLSGTGFSTSGAAISGMTKESTLQIGSVLLGVRAQGFVKSRFSGGALSDSVEITAHIDTGRGQSSGAFFDQLIAANRGISVFGDAAEEVQDVNTRGKFYGRVVAGDSSVVVGSVRTEMKGGGDLFRYQRTTDGAIADLHYKGENTEFSLRSFSTTATQKSVRDANWFRATGGTLFYLRHGNVVEGSEQVRVVIRDRDSGLQLHDEQLQEGVDYSVDYSSGRIRLTSPLSMTSKTSWVLDNMDSSATPMSSNTVFLNVQYEHESLLASAQNAKGVYASTSIEGRLEIGGGVISEERSGADPYRLLGGDASYSLGENSSVRAEVAASKQSNAGQFLSMDGGLSFGGLRNNTEYDVGPIDGYRVGWKISADLAAKDWSDGGEFEDTNLSLYMQDVDLGFSSGDAILDQGRFRFGGRLQHRLSNRDLLRMRHEGQIALLPRVGPTLSDVSANPRMDEHDERASYLTSIQWAREAEKWHYKIEGMHHRISSSGALENGTAVLDASRLGVGGLTTYELSSRTSLHIGQQFVSILGVADPVLNPIAAGQSSERIAQPLTGVVSNVGGELKLAPELSVGLDLYQRWNGDNAARIGMRSSLSEHGSMYIQEQVGNSDGRLSNVTIIGAEDRFGEDKGGRSYGEYQIDQGVLGNRNRAVMGLGRQWQLSRIIGIGLGFEAQQAFGGHLPDGTAIGNSRRHVLHTSLALTPTPKVRLASQVELRLDRGDSGPRVDLDVLGNDPRDGVPSGTFSDHGGVVPGAALLVAPGETIQLVAGVVADWRLNTGHTILARTRSSFSSYQPPNLVRSVVAHSAEFTGGWAYRPRRNDRFEILSRYSFLLGKRPSNVEEGSRTTRSHVLALLPYARLPGHFRLSGKLVYKEKMMREELERGGGVETTLTAVLAILRLGYQFYGNWDVSTELRQLSLFGSVNSESKVGSLLEAGYGIGQHLHLGAGYNFSHFSDNELGDLQRDSHGFFVRVSGHY